MKKQLVCWGILLFLAIQSFSALAAPVIRIAPDETILVDSCPLPPPDQVAITGATSSTLDVNWTAVPGAVAYNVRAKNVGTGIDEADYWVAAPTLLSTITGLTSDAYFEVSIRASACPTGPGGGPTKAFGSTTSIIIADIFVEAPCPTGRDYKYAECVPQEEFGNNLFPAFVGYIRSASGNSWNSNFALVAPCPEKLVFKMYNNTGNLLLSSTTNSVTIWFDSNNNHVLETEYDAKLITIKDPASGTGINEICPSPTTTNNPMHFHVTPETSGIWYERINTDNGFCTGFLPSNPCTIQHLTVLPGDSTLKILPASAHKTPRTASIETSPNPFTEGTTINYQVPEDSPVTLSLYNTMGRAVRILEQGDLAAGSYVHELETADLPSGVYYLVLQTATDRQVQTILKRP